MRFFVASMVVGICCKVLSAHYMGQSKSAAVPRDTDGCSSLLLSLSADMRSPGDVIAFKGQRRSVSGYLFYHSTWHYVVSVAGSMCQLQMYLLQNSSETTKTT